MTDFRDDNGWTENRYYDDAGRLTGMTTGPEGAFLPGDLSTFSVGLDPVGNPLEIVRTGTLEQTQTYSYDGLDRLQSVCFQAGTCPAGSDPFVRWSYDGVGNRLSKSLPSGTTAYSYNAADELLQAGATSYTYDENGNQKSAGARTFAYDLATRLKTTTLGSTTTTYSYDGEGKRLQASTGAAANQKTNFLWDPSFPLPQLVQESDGTGTALRRYRHGHRPLHVTSGSSVSYFHFDPLGSVVDLTAAAGGALRWSYGFEPYGQTRQEQQNGTGQPVNLSKFTGEYLDPSGLYHLRARQYDPGTGRFLSRDPVVPPLASATSSSYTYANARPTVLLDPSGLAACGGAVAGTQLEGVVIGTARGIGEVVHGVSRFTDWAIASAPSENQRAIRQVGVPFAERALRSFVPLAVAGSVAYETCENLEQGEGAWRALAHSGFVNAFAVGGATVAPTPCLALGPTPWGVACAGGAAVLGGAGGHRLGSWLWDAFS
jgi:RHS repeat-associated protein